MDVTADNFHELKPSIFDAINASDFVALDGEFSGLRRATPDQDFSFMDTLEERYSKVAASVREFGLLQVGLSCFQHSPEHGRYNTATFSFYILKKATTISDPKIFTVCSNSLRFLSRNSFDFNKLFKSGLPYLNAKESLHHRDVLPNKIQSRLGKDVLEKVKVVDVCKPLYSTIAGFIKKQSKQLQESVGQVCVIAPDELDVFSPAFIRLIAETKISSLHSPRAYVPPVHSSRTYCLEDVKRSNWTNLRYAIVTAYPHVDAVVRENESLLDVKVFTNKQDKEVFVYCSELDDFSLSVGFSHVLRHLLASQVPIVGHTCILDIFHIIDKFIEPLPKTLGEFKEIFNANFTKVYDTKYLVKNCPMIDKPENTSLDNLFNYCTSAPRLSPVISVMDGYKSYDCKSEPKLHDAGYDAFITGYSFAGLVRRLDQHRPDGTRANLRAASLSPNLQTYVNRVYLLHLIHPCMLNLSRQDEYGDRRGVIEIRCSVEQRYPSLKCIFTDLANPIIVGDNSAGTLHFMIPSNEEDKKRARTMLDHFQQLCPPGVSLKLYTPQSTSINTGSEPMEIAQPRVQTQSNLLSSPVISMPVGVPSRSTLDTVVPPLRFVSPPVPGTDAEFPLPPLTPRAEHLAISSMLDAKSPEFMPKAERVKSPINVVPDGLIERNSSVEDLAEEIDFSTSDETEETGHGESNSSLTINNKGATANPNSKRGEKRKSGQFTEDVKNGERSSKSSVNLALISANVAVDDWQTVRNRNRNKVWNVKGSSNASATANVSTRMTDTNRFLPTKGKMAKGGNSETRNKKFQTKTCKDNGNCSGNNKRKGGKRNFPDRSEEETSDNDGNNYSGPADCKNDLVQHKERRELKRLKSVGAEQLSNLSLNSPTSQAGFPISFMGQDDSRSSLLDSIISGNVSTVTVPTTDSIPRKNGSKSAASAEAVTTTAAPDSSASAVRSKQRKRSKSRNGSQKQTEAGDMFKVPDDYQ